MNEKLPDMSKRECLVLIPVVVFIIWIGVYPKPFLKPMEATVNNLILTVEQKRTVNKPVPGEIVSSPEAKPIGSQEEEGA